MTAIEFCKWVNNCLLPNSTLESGYPRKISVTTTCRGLDELGFEVFTTQKGIFIDGHECEDVVEQRNNFLRRMTKIGFLHFTNAPTENSVKAIPTDIEPPLVDQREKTVILFHDESTFSANEDQNIMWGVKGQKFIKPKSKGAGIMVSDFIDEKSGFLAFSDDEYEEANISNPNLPKYAREFLEYGESREGYWNHDKFWDELQL